MSAKEEYERKLRLQLDKWKTEIEELKVKADQAEIELKEKYNEQIEDLREEREKLQAKFDEFSASSGEAWEDMKAGLDIAWEGLSEAIKSAASRYR